MQWEKLKWLLHTRIVKRGLRSGVFGYFTATEAHCWIDFTEPTCETGCVNTDYTGLKRCAFIYSRLVEQLGGI